MTTTQRYTDYDTWAWLYNETMGPDYGKAQLTLLERVLLPELPTNAAILDLCCGTGQLMQPLLDAGYQVTGLDGSAAMLDYARQNAPQGHYLLEDARTFHLPSQFDAAFSTSASLNHIMALTDLVQVFRNVYQALQPGGLFIFDLNHPEQMQKWWCGKIVEGEITPGYAWRLTPEYQPEVSEGAFHVEIFQAQPLASWIARFTQPFKQTLYRLLSLRRLTRFRLRLLSRFEKVEPTWTRSHLTYRVKGHALPEVQTALQTVGFTHIVIQTIDGDPTLDANHSAHFICHKGSG
ncbi:class I SAM-dependent methyltransferase [Oscillatoria sp. CS-180]|uniref:class I SAM-dependent methyltransferase n=1 Tax=Oscillatoria sp. CS-180 TaxID=3021720 RepID=UPI00232B2A53|nr:class I SAM-dependent methyltransferase [Oscillatoria sp. CS-180]MDB9524609.1 class I SAM-dependent methyltransferase [Oscillatoria sp. CS-180]